MCGRYVSKFDADLERDFEIHRSSGFDFEHYNIAPTMMVPVVRLRDDSDREAVMMRWGLVPHWARGIPGKYATYNARTEDMRGKPAYRNAWKYGKRCLFPALGFYEWQAVEGQTKKQPCFITVKDGER